MRLVFLSLSYPTPWQPTAAVFNRAMVEGLAGEHTLEVVAPVPWPQRIRVAQQPHARGSVSGAPSIKVHHPLYLYPPGVLREHYGRCLWASCRRTLRRVTWRLNPDAFLAYWAHPDGEVMLRAAREAGRPCVVIVGGSDVMTLTGEPRRRGAITRVLQGVDAVLTIGRTLRERVIGLGVPGERVTAFHRGVDTLRFRGGDRREARARLSLPDSGRMVLWVGRMVAVKGLDVLLDAWRLLGVRAGDTRLCLVGDGPLRESLEAKTTALGLADRVMFVGPRAHGELGDWYRAADLTVLPSRSEGIPNVLLESIACGTPFVASDVGGIREIGPEIERWLVPAGDPIALASAIEERLREPGPACLPPMFSQAESTATITRVLEAAAGKR